MSEKKKILTAVLIVSICILLTILICYFEFSEKWKYDVRPGLFISFFGSILCFSVAIYFGGYTTWKSMQSRREEHDNER